MTSLQQLMVEEDERRAEQVIRARLLKQEQERTMFEEQARRAEEAQKRAEIAAREVKERDWANRVEAERLEGERVAHLERVRSNLELEAKFTLMKAEQLHEVERLTILRDARTRTLEGQRGLLVGLLATLFIGSLGIYFSILRPTFQRERVELEDLRRINTALRRDQEQIRVRAAQKISELNDEIATSGSKIEQLKRELLSAKTTQTRPEKPALGISSNRPKPVTNPCSCNKADPLCDCW
jgi:hypothetical protein